MIYFFPERKRRNKPFDDDDCVVFGPSGLPKRVLGSGRPVRGDGDSHSENDDF